MASSQNSKRVQEKKDNRKRTVVYSTKKIQEILDSMNSGYEPDMTPFFENDIEFRDANVPFEMTEWEKEEWLKCSLDPEYFISKYVSFQTDKGWKPVELREYQKKFIHLVNDEHWSDEVDTFVPDNKEVICLMARQSGKCFCDNTTVRLPFADLSEIYKTKQNLSLRRWLVGKFAKFVEKNMKLFQKLKDFVAKNVVIKLLHIEHGKPMNIF